MREILARVVASGEAYVTLVVGPAPEVRESVALDALEDAPSLLDAAERDALGHAKAT